MVREHEYGPDHWIEIDGRLGPRFDDVNDIVVSAGGWHLAYVAIQDGRSSVVVDGRSGPRFDRAGPPLLSPDGRWCAYSARTGDSTCVVVNGRLGPKFDDVGKITFSPAGNHLAYSARTGDKWRVFRDSKPGAPYDLIGAVWFSPNGKRLAFEAGVGYETLPSPVIRPDRIVQEKVGRDWKGDSDATKPRPVRRHIRKWQLVVDGQQGPECDWIRGFTFDTLSGRFAYVPVDGGGHFVVLDGQPGPIFRGVGDPRFSLCGGHLAYEARTESTSFMVLDGQPGPAFDIVYDPVFSPGKTHLAYFALRNAKWLLVRDGQLWDEWDAVGIGDSWSTRPPWGGRWYLPPEDPVFSPDGQRLMYKASRGDEHVVVVDSAAGPEFENVTSLTFSPNGKRVAYLARRGEMWSVRVDGDSGPEFGQVTDLKFSPDSRHIAYLGWPPGLKLPYQPILDGRPCLDTGSGGPIEFSPSGRHWACRWMNPDHTYSVIVDGRPGPKFADVTEPQFGHNESVVYLAEDDRGPLSVRHIP